MKFLLRTGTFIFILDILIVFLHLYLGSQYFVFNLDYEHNIPTIYQTIKLLLIAQLLFLPIYINGIFRKISKKEIFIWVPLILIFLFLGLDELGQIHENLHGYISQLFPSQTRQYTEAFSEQGFISSDWLILYLPLFFFFVIYLGLFIKSTLKSRGKSILLLAAGALIILCVPVVEYINTSGVEEGLYYVLMTFEELLEMIGISFFFIFSVQNYKKVSTHLKDTFVSKNFEL